MDEIKESYGRIEVAPEVVATIAYFAALRVEGVKEMAPIPPHVARRLRKSTKQDGVVLDLSDGEVRFDIYVIMDPNVNLMEKSRLLQEAVVEAVETMVGIPVDAINVHVEDVVYSLGETV